MKNLKTICLLIVLFCAGFNVMYAQQKTAYEKKKDELIIQLWSKYGQRTAQLIVNTAENKGDEEFIAYVEAVKTSGAKELAALHGRGTPEIDAMGWYANELKKAQKLKTAAEHQRDKEAKERKKQEEEERKLRAEREEYEKTDAGSILKNIKSAFEAWNQKGEFEKEADYAERIQNQSQTVFEGICLKEIKSKINSLTSYSWKKELSPYNSEKEFFTITFLINGIEWKDKINIPISQAENFKNNWHELNFKIDDYDWCFVENKLCPTLVVLENRAENSKYEFPVIFEDQSQWEIALSTFNYSNAKIIAEQQEKEKQRLDSLELATYNQKLDSIFQDYNRQLMQNPYNVENKIMSEYEKVKSEGYREENREYNFNRSLNSMKSNFEKLNNNFEQELKSKNPVEYCRIYYTQNPDKLPEADKKYLECRCNYSKREDFDLKFINGKVYACSCREDEYKKNGKLFTNKDEFDTFYDKGDDSYQPEIEKRAVLNFFEVNSNYVKSMDFQKEKTESLGSALGRGLLGVATGTPVSEKDYTNENEARKKILSLINECKEKPYYSQIMDLLIETNKKLNNEWTKNGQSFESKAEFYKAFVSDNYKQILKDKKKNK